MSRSLQGGHSGGSVREKGIFIPPRNDPTELSDLVLEALSIRGCGVSNLAQSPPGVTPLEGDAHRAGGVRA
jgi:hypothetical protein